uniref:TLC domain-containing protein n=1 Tax=Meloidogyne incognita TaxID=6306 RepID=A0A914LRQ2_MELIC
MTWIFLILIPFFIISPIFSFSTSIMSSTIIFWRIRPLIITFTFIRRLIISWLLIINTAKNFLSLLVVFWLIRLLLLLRTFLKTSVVVVEVIVLEGIGVVVFVCSFKVMFVVCCCGGGETAKTWEIETNKRINVLK